MIDLRTKSQTNICLPLYNCLSKFSKEVGQVRSQSLQPLASCLISLDTATLTQHSSTVPTLTGLSSRRGGGGHWAVGTSISISAGKATPFRRWLSEESITGWKRPVQRQGCLRKWSCSAYPVTLNTGATQMVSEPCETLGTWHTTWLMSHL